ncbi:MAG: SBBP repeat-containing protein [Verrucomicrobiales bacterium]|nr:SBBP repeat-containing protein [Verrucomicrobiales bacterium]
MNVIHRSPFLAVALFIGISRSFAASRLQEESLARLPATIKQLPLSFIENMGQWHDSSRFVASKGPITAVLETNSVGLHLQGSKHASVRITFEGATLNASLTGETQSPSHFNFFMGSDPACWRTNVPSYSSVLSRGLYPGVDLRVREQSGRLEYDLLLSSGASLDQVVVDCEGVTTLSVANDGALTMQTAGGILRQSPPTTWEVLADGRKRPVDCQFRIIDAHRYGFVAPRRESGLPLVIDPGLEWSTYLGGFGGENLTAVALAKDGTGDIFIGGYMNSPDFPFFNDANFTGFQNRIFVARLNSTGTILYWATFLGGWHSQVTHHGLAAAPDGGVVVTGENFSPDFPTTPGAYDRSASFSDAFVARLNAAGGLVFSTLLGGSGADEGYAVGFDPAGNIIVGGNTSSSDFPTTPGAFDRTYANPSDATQGDAHGDIFITRLTPDGSAVTYSTFIGGSSVDVLEDLKVDSLGCVNLAGWITGHNIEVFPTTADAFDRTWSGSQDAIFARLKLAGAGAADLKYSTLLGGSNQDNFFGVAVDPTNPEMITVAGMSWSDNFPVTAGVVKTTNPRFSALFESQAAVVARFHIPAAGPRTLTWSTYVGPVGPAANIRATDVTVTSSGEPIVIGLMSDRKFPTTRGAFDRLAEGFLNAGNNFVARLTADARQYAYASFFGGSGGDVDAVYLSPRVAYLGDNTVIIAGTTSSADFPVTSGSFDVEYAHPDGGGSDGFIMRFVAEPDASGDLSVGTPTLISPPNGATFPSGTFLARLQWTPLPDAAGIDGYEFEMSGQPDFSNANPGTTHEEEIIVPAHGSGSAGLILGTTYWRVRAYDWAGNVGAWSAPSSFSIDVPNSPPAIEFLDTHPHSLVGGGFGVGVIHLDKPAPAGGQTVTLHLRYNPSVGYLAQNRPIPLTIPAAITIPAGAVSALFDITSTPVSSTLAVDVIGMVNGVGRAAGLTLTTLPEAKLRDLVVSPNTVNGGTPSMGAIRLEQPAPPGGFVVDLATSHPQAARVPATVIVPAGETRATFPITTLPVAFDIDSYVDAFTGSSLTRQYIFVKPPGWPTLSSFTLTPSTVNGGTIVTGTVQFSGIMPFSTWPAFSDARVMTYSSDPSVAGMSPFVTVLSGESSASFTFMVRSVPANTTLNVFAVYDDVTLNRPLTINAGPPVSVTSMALNVSTVQGGQGGIASASLNAPAPAGGVGIVFTASDPSIYFTSEPAAYVPQGSTSVAVAFIANPVSETKVVNIIASYGTSSASAPVTVNPSESAERWVTSVILNPKSVPGGGSSTGTITLNSPAQVGGIVVQLFSSTSAATVPASVTVPPGSSTANFGVNTASVSSSEIAKIYALLNFSMAGVLNRGSRTAADARNSKPAQSCQRRDRFPADHIGLEQCIKCGELRHSSR